MFARVIVAFVLGMPMALLAGEIVVRGNVRVVESVDAAAGEDESAAAASTSIQRWKKPDGTLHFGDDPPPGSIAAGQVESLGTAGGGPVAEHDSSGVVAEIRAEREAARVARRNDMSRWRHGIDCSTSAHLNAAFTQSFGQVWLEGTIVSDVRFPIRNLQVCAREHCAAIVGGNLEERGASVSFSIPAQQVGGVSNSRLQVRCSFPY